MTGKRPRVTEKRHLEVTEAPPLSDPKAVPDVAVMARGLEKQYGEVVALAGLDLEVAAGSCFGLLGPNGAGKTTAVGILATWVRADAGEARVYGHDVGRDAKEVRGEIGIVFQEPTLDPQLTAREHLDLHARLYHMEGRSDAVSAGLRDAGLEDAADRPVRGYSGGMRRRLEIARGLLHGPRVLFLDEPTTGLDPAARAAVWERLRALQRERGVTLFLTTHAMEEADALCDRLAIVDAGRVVAEGSPRELKAGLGGDVVLVSVGRVDAAVAALGGVTELSHVVAQADPDDAGAGRVRIATADGPRRLAGILEALRACEVREVDLHRPSLDDVFLHHTGHAFEPAAGREEGG